MNCEPPPKKKRSPRILTFEPLKNTLSDFNTKKQWDRIVKNVLNNPEFYACVTSLNRKTFSIK